MSKFIKDEIKGIEISGIRKFNQLASSYKDIIKLTIGELDIDTPKRIIDKTKQTLDLGETKYSTNAGLLELRKEIAKKYNNEYNREYTPDNVIITVGTTEALGIIIKSIISERDEVIIPTPGYVGYEPLIKLEGGIVKELDTVKNNFLITKESLYKAYTPKTKCIIITNPNNPTGHLLSDEEMDIIKDFVLEKDILLISDEIYSDIVFEGTFSSFTKYHDLSERVVILNGYSKSHSMTGFRIGYLIAPQDLTSEFLKVHQYSVTCAPITSQHAALDALKFTYKKMLRTLASRREFCMLKLESLELPFTSPDGAFYIFVDISTTGLTGDKFSLKLLEYGVAVIPGEYFLGNHKNYVRIAYTKDLSELNEAFKRIETFIRTIK